LLSRSFQRLNRFHHWTSITIEEFLKTSSDTFIDVAVKGLFKTPRHGKLISFIQIQIADYREVVVSGTTVLLYPEYKTPF